MNDSKFLGAALAVVLPLTAIIVLSAGSRTQAGVDSSVATSIDAGTTFDDKCAKCHGKDGRGKSMRGKLVHARDLTSAQWQNDVTDERLFNSVSNGRGKMPSFKKKLSEAEIDALVAYVRRFKK